MSSATTDYALEQRVADARLRLVYGRLRLSVLLSVGVSLAFGALMAPLFPMHRLLLGLLVIQLVGLGRYRLSQYYSRANPGHDRNAFWQYAFIVGAIAAGASWGFGAVLLMPSTGRPETTLLLVMVLSVSSVAVATLAALYHALLGFLAAAMLPPVVALVLSGGAVESVAAAAMIAALLCLAAVGSQSSKTTTRLMRTEIELSRAMMETAAARVAAEASSRAKSRFLANMSHEVRTPLNGILGTVEILGTSALDARQRHWVGLLQQSADHLLQIVNEILDLSKIEAGKIELAEIEFDVTALVEETAALMRPGAERAGLRLMVEIAPDIPRRVIADPLRLRQVLLNLLANAVKFTERGFVAMRAWRDATFDGDHHAILCFEVADSGIGISHDATERIFEAFTQADDSAARRFGGTGLGLTVCRRLTEAMGGGIRVESRPGDGSRFLFTIRAQVPAAREEAHPTIGARTGTETGEETRTDTPRAPQFPSIHSSRVLLVEDNPVNLEVAVAMLESLGTDTVCACGGVEALEKVGEGGFDLVFMDCQMPDMDGYAATRELRRRNAVDRQGGHLPIIALTANAFAEDRLQATEAGMDDFVTKPVSRAALDGVLRRWLTGRPIAADSRRAADVEPSEVSAVTHVEIPQASTR
jgi:signal transduction histidine kinase/DNA-binding NarL/FixJ family response regulator